MANNCGNVPVRFSTLFILVNVGTIRNVKKRKKRDTNKNVKNVFYIYDQKMVGGNVR